MMTAPLEKEAARREPDGTTSINTMDKLTQHPGSDKLIIECGDLPYIVYLGKDGTPKIDPIDETTRWRISRRADGGFDVEIIIDELEGGR
jgi:hypothetical protein